MPTEGLTVEQLTTVAGLTTFTWLLSELLWRTLAVAEGLRTRFGPITAVAIGIGAGVGASLLLGFGGTDLAQSGINGVVGGLAAMGIHDLVRSGGQG
jgi:hypothetical protein